MRVRRAFSPFSTLAAVLFIAGPSSLGAQPAGSASTPAPPIAPVRPVVDDYYGTKVTDPYRYMENLKDPEVQAWMKSQNDYTRAVLAGIPGREKLLARMIELDESTSVVAFVQRLPGDLYLYRKLPAHENVPRLYMRRGLNGPEKLLLDPERITLAGANQSKGKNTIDDVYPSDDAKYAAVEITPGTLLVMQSWTKGRKIYAYDPRTKQVSDTKLQPAGRYDDPGGVEAVEVKVPSYDGTLVPLSIIHPKGMKLDGSNPTELTGYGAYGTTQNAVMDRLTIAQSEMGAVHAVCHVRGGGEYGEEWHLAGKGPTKPNTWRDFIACAEYLIANKYTSPARLAGRGESAGGIMIGRAITERPELFRAAIINVGPSDALRAEITNVGSIAEFGSTKTEDGFKALYAMSPYHQVKDRTAYPAILLTTGINDVRVAPWESAKMAARLQTATSSGEPVLLRVDYESGHGSATRQGFLENAADAWSFLMWQFRVPEFQPQQ